MKLKSSHPCTHFREQSCCRRWEWRYPLWTPRWWECPWYTLHPRTLPTRGLSDRLCRRGGSGMRQSVILRIGATVSYQSTNQPGGKIHSPLPLTLRCTHPSPSPYVAHTPPPHLTLHTPLPNCTVRGHSTEALSFSGYEGFLKVTEWAEVSPPHVFSTERQINNYYISLNMSIYYIFNTFASSEDVQDFSRPIFELNETNE